MSNLKAYILCRFADKSGIYNSWMDAAPFSVEVVKDFAPNWTPPEDAGLLVTHMHYRWEEVNALRRVYDQGRIPILILADGILEYRNIWEHPELADGCIFQPIVGHKLACIGQGQTRTVESWGNVGKCESIGLPRLDQLADQPPPAIAKSGNFRILIATANTPAFTQQQRASVVESLEHIRNRLTANSKVNGRDVDVTWRLTDGLAEEIGVAATEDSTELPPLSEVIDQVDAVITTPSTLFLESILKKRPTAILDFHNTPHYVHSAWMINAPKHFNDIIRELENPPAAKMLFQESELHFQLHCQGSAKDRLLELMQVMITEGELARQEDRDICLPFRVIPAPKQNFAHVPVGFDLKTQYPENPVFQNENIKQLQLELNLAIKRLGSLPAEITEKNELFDEMKAIRDDLLQRLEKTMDNNRGLKGRNQKLIARAEFLTERINRILAREKKLLERLDDMVKANKARIARQNAKSKPNIKATPGKSASNQSNPHPERANPNVDPNQPHPTDSPE